MEKINVEELIEKYDNIPVCVECGGHQDLEDYVVCSQCIDSEVLDNGSE